MPTNLWQPGVSGNPAGRLRGSRNALSEEVISALLRDFRQHGQKAVARVRRTQPAAYLKILALLVPREHKVEHGNAIKDDDGRAARGGIESIEAQLERSLATSQSDRRDSEAGSQLPAARLERPAKHQIRLIEQPTARSAAGAQAEEAQVPSPAST